MKQLRELLTKEAKATKKCTSDLDLQCDCDLLIYVCKNITDLELAKFLNNNTLLLLKCLSKQGKNKYYEIIKRILK
jgi:hypothetical protein